MIAAGKDAKRRIKDYTLEKPVDVGFDCRLGNVRYVSHESSRP